MSELDAFREQWLREVESRNSSSQSASQADRTAGSSSGASLGLQDRSRDLTSDFEHVEVVSSRDFKAYRPTNVYINKDLLEMDILALEKFETAVDMEHCGSFADAVATYREAFQLNEHVDKLYREKYFSASIGGAGSRYSDKDQGQSRGTNAKVNALGNADSHSDPHSDPHTALSETDQLKESFDRLEVFDPENELEDKTGKSRLNKVLVLVKPHELRDPEACPLMAAPAEIVVRVMEMLALTDLLSFTRFLAVNKYLHDLGNTSQSIWKALCMLHYTQQIYGLEIGDYQSEEAEEQADVERNVDLDVVGVEEYASEQAQETLVNKYWNGSWKQMFEKRPFLRFNGVYISTCTYLRQGLYSGWSTPVQMITYYRYARFYADGTCICLLTSLPPIEVVPMFYKQTVKSPTVLREDGSVLQRPKGIVSGTWKLKNLDGELLMETEGSVDRYKFFMNLSIRSSGSRRHNKLKWIRFWSVNKLTGDMGEFSLKNDKAYYFVRTKR